MWDNRLSERKFFLIYRAQRFYEKMGGQQDGWLSYSISLN
jgi:hypothetical protein